MRSKTLVPVPTSSKSAPRVEAASVSSPLRRSRRSSAASTGLIDPRARVTSFGLVLQAEGVDAGPRGRRQCPELVDAVRVVTLAVREESLGDEHQRFRCVHGPQVGEHVTQAAERAVGILTGLCRDLQRLVLDFHPADRDGALRSLAIARHHLAERQIVAAVDGQRGGESQVVGPATDADFLLLPGKERERSFQLIVVGDERGGLGARAESYDGDAIRTRQPVDEGIDGITHGTHVAERNIRLVDREDDEPAAGGLFVRHVAVGQRRRRGRALRVGGRGNPLGADHAARPAVQAHREVGRDEIANGLALPIHHRHFDRQCFDARSEHRRLCRLLLGIECSDGRRGENDRKRRAPARHWLDHHLGAAAR